MIQVELVYDTNCPNVEEARRVLAQAFAAAKLTAHWQEWERGSPGSPPYVRNFGSPTVLVNGVDVEPQPAVADCGACRVYPDEHGKLRGVPRASSLVAAISEAQRATVPPEPGRTTALKQSLPALPAIGIALLPKLTCPLCWPAYTALLSAMGIGFINYTSYLLPLMTVFLVLTLAMLGYRARTRRGLGPFALGCVATAIILIGKFLLDSDLALYGGVTLLVGASLWNAWPKRVTAPCPACVSTDSSASAERGPIRV